MNKPQSIGLRLIFKIGVINMMYMYTGTPGSGKSYHLAKLIYDNLRTRVNIICNFPINLDLLPLTKLGWRKKWISEKTHGKVKFKKYNRRKLLGTFTYIPMDDLSPDYLMQFAVEHHNVRREAQTILIIDEAEKPFNCRDFKASGRKEWLDFFANHRHFGYDVILCCQFDRQLDRQIRYNVEYEIIHRKLRNYKTLGLFLSLVSGGNIFLVKTIWYASKDKVGNDMTVLRYEDRIGALYDTFADFLRSSAPPDQAGVWGPSAEGEDDRTEDTNLDQALCDTNNISRPSPGAVNCVTAYVDDLDTKFAKWNQIMGGERNDDSL